MSSENTEFENQHTCGFCIFYKKSPAQLNQGECHRYPPQVVPVQQRNSIGQTSVGGLTMFPAVNVKTWCGEFESYLEEDTEEEEAGVKSPPQQERRTMWSERNEEPIMKKSDEQMESENE